MLPETKNAFNDMKFLTEQDLHAGTHREILDGVTRGDAERIDTAEREAIDYIAGYISARYDVEALFSATGAERSDALVAAVRDVTLYHLYSAHNPQKMTQITVDRYENTRQWLKEIQAQTVNPIGWPLCPNAAYILYSSNPKKGNHF